jgi:stage II sporulation protein D
MTEPSINVGIISAQQIHFVLVGPFASGITAGNLTGSFTASLHGDTIMLRGEGQNVESRQEVVFVPKEPAAGAFVIRNVTIGVHFHWERKEDQKFVGNLKLVQSNDGITAINVVSIEDYLASVISSEMSAESSTNLLKAHAVTSRSWLLAQLEKSKKIQKREKRSTTVAETDTELIRWYDREDHDAFDVCADDHCQRYQGVTKAYTDSVRRAVQETRGQVLVVGSQICDARFSKSCGGISERYEHVWEPVAYPYLVPVVDSPSLPEGYGLDFSNEANAEKWIRGTPPAFCNIRDRKMLSQVLLKYDQKTSDFYRWTVESTQEEISSHIHQKSGIDFGQIVDLIPVERGASARLIKLKIVGTRRTMTIGKELEIRRTLSPTHLYSSAFVVDTLNIVHGIPGKFQLRGAGWGHGVGLCQIGAAVMGELGNPFDKILAHYFTGARIQKLY